MNRLVPFVALAAVLAFLITNIDNFTVGKVLDTTQLGFYSVAYGYGYLPVSLFSGPAGQAFFPSLTKVQADLDLLREADVILIDELKASGYYTKTWQAFAVLLNVKSVGVMGDNRTYDNTVCVRVVEAVDGMTATFAHLPHDLLERISRRIINEVNGINRVVYDISSKPPATIEWE